MSGERTKLIPSSGSMSTDMQADRQWIQGAIYAMNCMESERRDLVEDAINSREQLILDAKKKNT